MARASLPLSDWKIWREKRCHVDGESFECQFHYNDTQHMKAMLQHDDLWSDK